MNPKERERAHVLENQISAIFSKYGTERVPPEEAARLRPLIDELKSIVEGAHGDSLRREWKELDDYLNAPVNRPPQPGGSSGGSNWGTPYSGKSLGELFVESPAFKSYSPAERRGPASTFEVKTLLSETGWAPKPLRIPRVEPYPTRPLSVLDVFGQGETTQSAVTYMEETTFTNAAAETAEGSDKPESALAFTERTAAVRTIATVLPATNQLLEDVEACRAYIDERLAYMVKARLDSQLLNGSGVAPNLTGILNTSGIQTQAKGTDPTPDAILKAMDLVRVNSFYEPDAVILHPNDWQAIRLLRTADGLYIWGNPAEPGPGTIWGKPVVATTAITENTGLVGAFKQAAMVFFRRDLEIAVSDSHSDFFIKNQVMVRAEVRVALACFRPSAFCQVTGI
jgi:hypothetical protein